ncbi:MAG: acetyl-CoA carboxylase biotin carboxyl carrier protein [Phascolarctobacterium sp.]|nr:acetyl-CoA carboxylase biotin carboxyl carrier protein [Phascolarctobacterium sp.]
MLSLEEIKALIEMVEESNLEKFELKSPDCSLLLEKSNLAPKTAATSPNTTVVISSDAAKGSAPSVEELIEITAPIVGTFYLTPEPGAEPFVQVGSKVFPDSVVCILEAMKLFTEIEADCTGEIAEILVNNGDFVEFGQPLFKIRAC